MSPRGGIGARNRAAPAAAQLLALSVVLWAGVVASQPAPPPSAATVAPPPVGTPASQPAPGPDQAPQQGDEEGIVDLTGAAPAAPAATPAGPGPPYAPPPYAWPPPGAAPHGPAPPPGPPPPPPAPSDEPDVRWQRYVGLGPRIGNFWGFGAGARAGHPYAGFDVSGGWKPVLATLDPPDDQPDRYPDPESELHGYHAWQLNGHVYVAFNPGSRFVAGLTAGYRYNSLLRHGVALGFDGVINLSDHFGLHLTGGPVLFPDGDERLRKAKDIPEEIEFAFPGPGGNLALGIGLLIYP